MSNPDSLKLLRQHGRSGIQLSLARVPESDRVFFGSSDASVYCADLAEEKLEPQAMAGHASYVTGLAWAAGRLVSGGYDRQLIWWDADSREQVRRVDAHEKWIRRVVASPDGSIVASVADDMLCRLWDAQSGEMIRELRGHDPLTPHHFPSMLFACAFSADGGLLATADKVGNVVVWETASGRDVARFVSPEHYTWDPRQRRHSIGGVRSLAFSPDGKLLATGGIGKIGNVDHLDGQALVHVFNWADGEHLFELRHGKHKGLVNELRFHHEGRWLLGAGGSGGGFLLFMDVAEKKFLRDEDATMHVHAIALDEASQAIYAAGHGKLMLWRMDA